MTTAALAARVTLIGKRRQRNMKPKEVALILLVSLLSAAVGCGPGAEHSPEPVQWLTGSEPILDVAATATEGSVLFERPIGATRLSDGAIAIGDRAGVVVYIDSRGHVRSTSGKRGQGPNELEGVAWLGQCGPDSVYAWDAGLRRMTVLDREGRIERQYAVPFSSMVACSRDGHVALVSWPDFHSLYPGTRPPRASAQLSLADPGDGTVRTVAEIPMWEGFPPPPLGKNTSIAVSDEYLFVGSADSAAVDRYPVDGGPAIVMQVPARPRAASPAHFERAIDAILEEGAPPDQQPQLRDAMREHYPMPAELPVYSGVFTDSEGLLWIVTSFPGDSVTEVMAVGVGGEAKAVIRMPQEITLFEIGANYLLGSYEEETGEPHVVEYSLRRVTAP